MSIRFSGAGRIAYLNGTYLPIEEARLPIFGRGFNLGDGIYEVTTFVNRHMVDFDAHLARLRSTAASVLTPRAKSSKDSVLSSH